MESAAAKVGTDSWEKAKKVWERLHPQLSEEVKSAAEKVATRPESEGYKAVFGEELEALLKGNPELARAISEIMAEGGPEVGVVIRQTVMGDGNQVIGQMTGGAVVGNVSINK